MAQRARPALEDGLPALRHLARRRRGGGALGVAPAREVLGGLGDHGDRHVRVLVAAELGALSAIDSGGVGLNHERAVVSGHEVTLSVQTGNPEAVDDVRGDQTQRDRTSDRNVELVGREEGPARLVVDVADLPPPLRAGHLDLHRIFGLGGQGATRQDAGDEQPEQRTGRGEGGGDDPARAPLLGCLVERAERTRGCVRGKRLAAQRGPWVVARARTATPHRECDRPQHEQRHGARHRYVEPEEAGDGVGERPGWRERIVGRREPERERGHGCTRSGRGDTTPLWTSITSGLCGLKMSPRLGATSSRTSPPRART